MSCGCAGRARKAMLSLKYKLIKGRWYDTDGSFVIHDVMVDRSHTRLLGVAIEAVLAEGQKRTGAMMQRLFG